MDTLDITALLAAVGWSALIIKAGLCTIPALPPLKKKEKRL